MSSHQLNIIVAMSSKANASQRCEWNNFEMHGQRPTLTNKMNDLINKMSVDSLSSVPYNLEYKNQDNKICNIVIRPCNIVSMELKPNNPSSGW